MIHCPPGLCSLVVNIRRRHWAVLYIVRFLRLTKEYRSAAAAWRRATVTAVDRELEHGQVRASHRSSCGALVTVVTTVMTRGGPSFSDRCVFTRIHCQ